VITDTFDRTLLGSFRSFPFAGLGRVQGPTRLCHRSLSPSYSIKPCWVRFAVFRFRVLAACQVQFGCATTRHIRYIRSNAAGFVSQFLVLRVLPACQGQFGCAIARHSHHNRLNAVGFVRQFSVVMRLPRSPCTWTLGSFGSFPYSGKCRGVRSLGFWVRSAVSGRSQHLPPRSFLLARMPI
jgi:hypothetical protein